ncbi:MAG: response regulator [Alphaproteobacteria bacterium]|nr:response regulator [Alphaproteobacteria bacterium]
MAKVLFVDDEPDIELLAKQKFRKQIASGIFDLLFAQNGQEALDLIKKEPGIMVVVSDVNMPEMDGLTLLDKLNEMNPSPKTIVVSAYGDTKTLRATMNKGAFDFVTKPIDFNELEEAILRALAQYERFSSLLGIYQRLLTTFFPKGIDLIYSPGKVTLLWDAFILTPHSISLLGVSVLPSAIPFEIATSTAHGVLKSALNQNLDVSLAECEEKLSTINAHLKAQILIGTYNVNSHIFSYKTNGAFKVSHFTSESQIPLISSETTFLAVGEGVVLENPLASSRFSLMRRHED